jgi:hypothetical protein
MGAIRNKSKMMSDERYCIYVPCKTRKKDPFFVEKSGYFDGSLLCLYPKTNMTKEKVLEICDILNRNIDFTEYNMHVNGRYSFGQRTISNVLINTDVKC